MAKIKKIIGCIWLIVGLIVMYASEAWEYIYLRQHGSEHPNENRIIGSMFLIWVAPIIIVLIINVWKNRGKPKQYADLSWGYFGCIFFLNLMDKLIENRAMKTVNAARALQTEIAINNAVKKIIMLYTAGFVAVVTLFFILELIDKKKKKAVSADSTEKLEKEWF